MVSNQKPYEPTRPYRLQRTPMGRAAGTFASIESAQRRASDYLGKGIKYYVVKRLNKSGSKTEVVAEGVS